jgi:hypothetical protein
MHATKVKIWYTIGFYDFKTKYELRPEVLKAVTIKLLFLTCDTVESGIYVSPTT